MVSKKAKSLNHGYGQCQKTLSTLEKSGLRRKDGYEKASGRAIYNRDIYRPGMLYAKFLLSPYAHAKIKSMDISKAEALPGVWDVLRYDDPEAFFEDNLFGMEVCLKDHNNWFPEQIGALVTAESEAICDQALKLIEIEMGRTPSYHRTGMRL